MRPTATALLLGALALSAPSPAAEPAPPPAPARAYPPVALPRSETRTVTAASNGRAYRVFVAWPDVPAPAAGFPVVYVLDANAWFATTVETLRVLSGNTRGTGVVPALVVGIGYPTDKPHDPARRTYDFTPARPGAAPTAESGGADAFLAFLEDELKPALARDHPIDPARQTLLGHSYGGLFVLHTLLTRPAAFQTYAALSPSIWWGDRAVLAAEPAFPARLAAAGPRRLFLTFGEYDQTPDPAHPRPPDRAKIFRENRMIDNARELAARLTALPGSPLAITLTVFPAENHGSVVPGAISRALSTLLAEPR